MKTHFNAFAFLPEQCNFCKEFIWLERFRYEESRSPVSILYSCSTCKDCFNKQLKEKKEFEK